MYRQLTDPEEIFVLLTLGCTLYHQKQHPYRLEAHPYRLEALRDDLKPEHFANDLELGHSWSILEGEKLDEIQEAQ